MDENEVSNEVVDSSEGKSLEEILGAAYDSEIGNSESDDSELLNDDQETSDEQGNSDGQESAENQESQDQPIDPEISEDAPKEIELPQETKEYIHQLEIEKQISDGFKSVVDPHMDFLTELGVNPFEHAQQLFQLSRALHTSDDAGKAAILADLFVGFGVSADAIEAALNERLTRPAPDPVMQKLTALEQKIDQRSAPPVQAQPAQPDPAMVKQIQEFSAKHEFFETVKQDMGVLLQSGRAQNLQEAYKMACRMNDTVQSTLKSRASQSQKAASQSVAKKTTTSTPKSSKGKDLYSILSDAYDEGE